MPSSSQTLLTSAVLSPFDSRSVTLVIPCLNEEGNLERLFQLINRAYATIGFTLPVLLVDDGSTDDSPRILQYLSQQYSFLTVIRHPKRRGVASVWKTALTYVTTDWILWGQADLESDPETDIPLLLQAWEPNVAAIAGWRQGRGDGKIFASSFANAICRLAFGLKIHDMNWIKLVRRDLLLDIPLELTTHRYLLAVLAGFGYQVIETPTPWHPRFSGKSKFGKRRLLSSTSDFLRLLWWFYVLRLIVKGSRYFSAATNALKVGLQASREAFYLQLEAQQTSNLRGR